MTPLISKKDFDCIGQVVNHCDLKKLNQAICEAQDFDLRNLFCDSFWYDIEQNWEDEKYKELVNGATFENCSKGQSYFKGIKTVLAYYSYSRYLQINQINDTAVGHKQKNTNFSIPIDKDVINQHSDRYRSMGYDEFKRAEAYLCLNKDNFNNFDCSKCAPCGCNGFCGKKTKAKGYGFKSKIIKKNGL